MKYQVYNLREKEIDGFMPKLTAYVIDDNHTDTVENRTLKRPAIIVCPGGGYGFKSVREGEPIALQFMAAGYVSFVLDYAVAPIRYPEPQKNLSDAISFVRKNADEWGIDKDKIAVIGFSAGGHLAGSVATMWDEEPLKTPDGSNKPNAAILSYPVISSDPRIAHMGSFDNLCGDDEELKKKMSLETRVTEKTPPCFIWHTFDDNTVHSENSLVFAKAMRDKNIPFELHIFPKGVHGLALCNTDTANGEWMYNPYVSDWVPMSIKWLNNLFEKNVLKL